MIRVLVVDDQTLVRRGLAELLGQSTDIRVVGEAGDGEEALRLARELAPDVVLLDVRMPGRDPLEAAMEVLSMVDPPKIVVVAASMQGWLVRGALAFGATGFVLKDDVPSSLPTAIREVMQGRKYLSPTVRLMHPDEV